MYCQLKMEEFRMNVKNEEALNKAMAELDDLEKSESEQPNEIDDLTKSLEAELGTDLSKSCKKTDGGKNKYENENEDEDEDEDEDENEDENENNSDPKGFGKSQDSDAYDEELVKASEAFASLEKSVSEMGYGVTTEINDIKKSLTALLNLNIKQAKVIATLAKSQNEVNEQLTKSISFVGSQPTMPNKAVIGTGTSIESNELKKSISEVSELLVKAVQEKKIDSRYLSIFGTHKDVSMLSDDVKKIIGL